MYISVLTWDIFTTPFFCNKNCLKNHQIENLFLKKPLFNHIWQTGIRQNGTKSIRQVSLYDVDKTYNRITKLLVFIFIYIHLFVIAH